MKTHLAIATAVLLSLISVHAQNVAPSTNRLSVEQPLGEIKAKRPLLRDAGAHAKETKAKEALLQLQNDPELAALRNRLAKASNPAFAKPEQHGEAGKISEELVQKEFEKIVALHPELKDYLQARLDQRKELMSLLGQHAHDPAARAKILQAMAEEPKAAK
ncbi:MAG: hypothetical protein AB1705_16420 [Verrucomicrobiota bacterium]